MVTDISDIDHYPSDLLQNNPKTYDLSQAQIDSIAVDWVTHNIYFGDKRSAKFMVMDKDGKILHTLAERGESTVEFKILHSRKQSKRSTTYD